MMTVETLIERLKLRIDTVLLVTDGHWSEVEADLQALVYDESKRCAAVAFANPLGEGQFIGQEILASSPGRGGG